MTDPRTKDALNRSAGWSMRDAIEDTGKVADELGVTRRQVRHYWNGHQSNRLRKAEELLDAVDDPWRLVKHLEAYVKWKTVRRMNTRELVERFHALVDSEHDREARQNRALQMADDTEQGVRACMSHASTLTEIGAVWLELEVRDVDPFEFSRSESWQ